MIAPRARFVTWIGVSPFGECARLPDVAPSAQTVLEDESPTNGQGPGHRLMMMSTNAPSRADGQPPWVAAMPALIAASVAASWSAGLNMTNSVPLSAAGV